MRLRQISAQLEFHPYGLLEIIYLLVCGVSKVCSNPRWHIGSVSKLSLGSPQ